MAEVENKKYLDEAGLRVLWNQAKAKFIDESELATELAKYYTKAEVDTLMNNFRAEMAVELGKKVDTVVNGDKGTSRIFNEKSGGGSKFEGSDTTAYVGVHDSIGGKIGTQIYVDHDTDQSTIIDVTADGAFYTKGAILTGAQRDVEDNEIATKKDIKAMGEALHYIGMAELASGETLEQAHARVVAAYQTAHSGYTLKAGAVDIINSTDGSREYIYDGTNWDEFGNEGIYETKAEAQAAHEQLTQAISTEVSERGSADAALDTKIEAEIARAQAAEATKTTEHISGSNGESYVWNESSGGGARFVNNNGVESFVGVNDGTNGLVAQIYADKLVNGKWQGAKLDVTNGAMYYTVGDKSFAERAVEDNEIATIGDVKAHDPQAMTQAEIEAICN